MKRGGFTLIELLIVVAIIGILAAIAVPNFLNAQIRAKVARAVSNMKTVSSAMEMYYLDHNTYTEWAWDSSSPVNNYVGFRWLTTPIAYISSDSAMENPFKARKDINTTLLDGREVDPFFELGTWSPNLQRHYPRNTYLLESSGPDLGDDYNANNFPRRGLVYQPSNGLHSRGDIFRGGGAQLPGWASAITY